jgi:hypothetical protein
LSGVPDEACRLIKQLQPFQRPTPDDEPLWILHSLCNRDKHRVPNLTIGYQRNREIRIPTTIQSTIVVRLPERFYIGDVETVPLPGDPSTIEDDGKVQATGRGMLCLRSTEPWAERPVDELLSRVSVTSRTASFRRSSRSFGNHDAPARGEKPEVLGRERSRELATGNVTRKCHSGRFAPRVRRIAQCFGEKRGWVVERQ